MREEKGEGGRKREVRRVMKAVVEKGGLRIDRRGGGGGGGGEKMRR